jgi:hypothetical protein
MPRNATASASGATSRAAVAQPERGNSGGRRIGRARQVPFVSIYSRDDRIVDWRSHLDPDARHREVRTTHGGLLCSTAALTTVAEELHRVLQAPDAKPSGWRVEALKSSTWRRERQRTSG